jgi:Ca-activated chloride channel family protein
MTADDREVRLTAYALGDPGLSPADRRDVETLLTADPTAARAVEETRRLAHLLTSGLAAEQAALPVEPAVTIPAPERTMRTSKSWARPVVAAAAMLIAAGGLYLGWTAWKPKPQREFAQANADRAPGPVTAGSPTAGTVYGQVDYDGRAVHAPDALKTGDKGAGAPGEAAAQRLQAELDQNKSERDGLVAPTKKEPGRPAFGGRPADGPPGLGMPPGAPGPVGQTPPGGGAPGGPSAGGGYRPGTPGAPEGEGRPRTARAATTAPAAPTPVVPPPADPRPTAKPDPSPERRDGESRDKDAGWEGGTNDRHLPLVENAFTRVEGINALSTFGVDVDTASYAIVRKYLTMGQLPPPTAVRLEEMVNYFPYADKAPDGNDPFAVTVEMADCPWEPAHRLARLGLKAKPIDNDKRPPSNLVFLIDVSGSMNAENRLPLVKASLKLLVAQLRETDRVAMVVYAGTTGVVLDSTSAEHKDKIVEALDRLEAGGSTNGSGGIQQAYEVAAAHFIKNGTNRVILCTDGDWNVGTTSTDALVKLIEQKRETGVYLSVFGFGMGNLRDEMMVQLAGKGNGNYAYIDTLKEAHKAFVEQLGGTLVTVAKDVKIQIEFNPAVVKSYRLLGYEKRALAAKDFHDDTKDAGEMGAGHVVTALYELVPVGAPDPAVGKVDGLRYQKDPDPKPAAAKGVKTDEAFVVKMRHKKPDSDTSTLRELAVKDKTAEYGKASEDFQFAAAVASFAMLLKDSPYKGQSSYPLVLELAGSATKHDPSGYRAEFVELVKKAKSLAGK